MENLSKEAIKQALIKLMSEKGFLDITITELVKTSGVARATFYRNYKNKEEVIKEILNDLNKEITSFVSQDFSDLYNWYLNIFQTFNEHYHILKMLIKIQDNTNVCFKMPILISNKNPNLTPIEKYQALVIEGSFIRILENWIVNNQKETPEEMAKICSQVMPSYTKDFILEKTHN